VMMFFVASICPRIDAMSAPNRTNAAAIAALKIWRRLKAKRF
jgi:hypothetical protein